MARHTFGGSIADFGILRPSLTAGIVKAAINATGGTAWSARTGGFQYTDLIAVTGGAPIGTDGDGFVHLFQGPDTVTELWVDWGTGLRLQLRATDPDVPYQVFTVQTFDTTGIQSACDDCDAAGGGIVYMRPGDYVTTQPIATPRNGTLKGAGREATTITYTGSTTAVVMYNAALGEQKLNVGIEDLTIVAHSATTGIDAKGMTMGRIKNVILDGSSASSSTAPTAGTIGVKWDGSYGASVGCWWNMIDGCWITGWDTCVKSTGTVSVGQANENTIRNSRLNHHNKGFWVDVGDHNTIEASDLSSSVPGNVGVYVNDSVARVSNCRFESVTTCVRVTSNADRWVIERNSFYNTSGTAVLLDSGTLSKRGKIANNSYALSLTANVVDNETATGTDGSILNYYGAGLVPLTFYRASVAASLTSSPLDIVGAVGCAAFPVGRGYQIRGISVRMSTARTAGTLTVKPTIGGTESTTLSAVIGGTDTTVKSTYQSMAKDVNATGASSVGVKLTTDAAWLPITANVVVTVWIEFIT